MKVLLFMLLGLAVAGGAWAQPYEVLERVDRLVDLSGIVMVADTGEVVYQKSFGFADHQSKKAIDEHTLFPLASLTKPFTAMAIGLLQEQGRLDFDDPIAEYLVQFASNPTLTIRHLVEHRSGLIRDLTDQRVISPYELIELEDLVDAIAKAPMRSKAGSTYQYSNANYQVLARLVEAVADQSYESYLKEYILQPAGMTATCVLEDFGPPELAKGHAHGNLLAGYHFSHAYGSGNLASTVSDLYAFEKARKAGVFGVPSKLLGWMHGSLQGRAYREHTGHLGSGYATCLRFFEDEDLVVIVLLNTRFPDVLELVDALSAEALGLSINHTDGREWDPVGSSLDRTAFRSSEGNSLALQMKNGILMVQPAQGSPIYLKRVGEGVYCDPEHPLFTHHLFADESGSLSAYEIRGLVRSTRYERVF